MPSNTTFNPETVEQFEKDKLNFDAQGVIGSCAAASGGTPTVANMDYLLTDDCLITGCIFIVNQANWGDFCHFQIVDASGALASVQVPGQPTGVTYSMIPGYPILNQFATNWYVCPTTDQIQLNIIYPAKIVAGLTLRVAYNNVGANAASFAMNYQLHKVLI